VFRRKKPPQVQHVDLIDLLLDSDEPTRRLLLFQALRAGALKKSEAEEVIATVSRLERAAGPRTDPIARKALAKAAAAAEATTQQVPAQAPAKAA
jgi:hypothetical protein